MISNIKRVKNASALVYYLLEKEPSTQGKSRVLRAKGLNASVRDFVREVNANAERFNKQDKIGCYSIVLSWSKDELDPDSEEDIEKAMQTAERVVQAYGSRQALMVAQNDGTGGNLHIHIALSNVSLTDGKCISGALTGHKHLKAVADRSQDELGILNKNKDVDKSKSRTSIREIKMKERGEYVWKDDLKERLKTSLNSPYVHSVNDYLLELQKMGVTANERASKKNASGYVIAYTFTDKTGKQRKSRDTRLGVDFELDSINQALVDKRRQQQIRQQQEQQRLLQQQQKQQLEREQRKRDDVPELITVDSLLRKNSNSVLKQKSKSTYIDFEF